MVDGNDVRRMYGYIYGNWSTMITCAYAELDLAGALQDAPRTVDELATLTATERGALARLLRCAEVLGLHRTLPDGRLQLTGLGALLSSRSASSLRSAARLNGAEYRYQPWGRLLDYLRSGEGKGLSPTWEQGSLAYLRDRPMLLQVFEEAMTDLSRATHGGPDENAIIARALDVPPRGRVLDIGGGHGSLVAAILRAHPDLEGGLFDLACVLEAVEIPKDLEGRLHKVPGDFRRAIPAGYGVYLLKNVLHNHPEPGCLDLLGHVRAAMGSDPGGRLFLVEFVMPDDPRGDAPFVDLNLNLLVGGSIRTQGEMASLLARAGLRMESVRPLPGLERRVVEARVGTSGLKG